MTKIEGAVVNAVGQLTGAVSSRSLTGLVASGGMIVNDWQITMEEIEGGHRLTARRGTEVQTMDIMDGEAGEDGYTPVKGVDYFDGESGVYVGSEEPDDPNIQVWIDPNGKADEPSSPGTSVQPDWNQNDETQPDYVKNRTHSIAPMFFMTWDGVVGDRFSIPLDAFGAPGYYFVHQRGTLNGIEITADNLDGSTIRTNTGISIIIYSHDLITDYPGAIVEPNAYIGAVTDSALFAGVIGVEVPEGIYFAYNPDEDFRIESLKGADRAVPLHPKYLPELSLAYPTAATKSFLFHLFSGEVPKSAFAEDDSIEHVKTSTFVTLGAGAFRECKNLVDVKLPKVKHIGAYAFSGCEALTTVDFSELERAEENAFSGCKALTTVILRNTSSILADSACPFTDNSYIYVPSNLVSAYQDSRWPNNMNDRIRAIEDYPEITGG